MPRLVKKEAHGPQQVGDKFICMCGLSKNQPFCDGSHNKTLSEDDKKLYWYDDEGKQTIVETDEGCSEDCGEECCGQCEGDCCKTDKKSK